MIHTLLEASHFCSLIQLDELACLSIEHPNFQAKLLLQGAQLLDFSPAGDRNWFYLSPQARYQQGQSVRGGVPICWPWFGQANKNPSQVQQHIITPDTAPAHGFARSLDWQLNAIEEDAQQVKICLSLPLKSELWQPTLDLNAEFSFSASELKIQLTTTNNSAQAVCFSQALHSYFPTTDITATSIQGFDRCSYVDTLDGWKHKTQQNNIYFVGETDRIYQSAPSLTLHTPEQTLTLDATGSHSTVVWNPWIDKSKTLSQFSERNYLQMFCIETANALNDAITLAPKQTHCLALRLHK